MHAGPTPFDTLTGSSAMNGFVRHLGPGGDPDCTPPPPRRPAPRRPENSVKDDPSQLLESSGGQDLVAHALVAAGVFFFLSLVWIVTRLCRSRKEGVVVKDPNPSEHDWDVEGQLRALEALDDDALMTMCKEKGSDEKSMTRTEMIRFLRTRLFSSYDHAMTQAVSRGVAVGSAAV